MKKQLFMLAFAMVAMTASAQTVIFDGESGSKDPWWGDASATIVDNPTKAGINISDKCLQITANSGQKCAKLGMGGTSLNGMRRISFMIKMPETGVNVKVKLIKDGAYYLSRAVWYDGDGAWQKKTVLFPEASVADANTCIELFPHENESYSGDLVAYIDNVQLEGAIVGGAGIDGRADNTISAGAKITGILAKGTEVCSDMDHGWSKLSYDDYVKMNSKFSNNITSVDITEATISDFDANQFFWKNPNNLVYAADDHRADHANILYKDGEVWKANVLNLNQANPFAAPTDFNANTVHVYRSLQAGINTMCLPFYVGQAEISTNCKIATFKNGTTFTFVDHADANVPFLATDVDDAVDAGTGLTFYDKGVCATGSLGTTFVGVYAPRNAENLYGINDDGKLQKGSSGATIKSFRAYLTAVSGAREITFEDETTGLTDVSSKTSDGRGECFNLAGQRVAQPTKGLYIVNGRKVVIK